MLSAFLMNLYLASLLAATTAPGMLVIIYWLLIILWAIGAFGFRDNPSVVRGSNVVLIILFAILGFYVFGF